MKTQTVLSTTLAAGYGPTGSPVCDFIEFFFYLSSFNDNIWWKNSYLLAIFSLAKIKNHQCNGVISCFGRTVYRKDFKGILAVIAEESIT